MRKPTNGWTRYWPLFLWAVTTIFGLGALYARVDALYSQVDVLSKQLEGIPDKYVTRNELILSQKSADLVHEAILHRVQNLEGKRK